MEHSFFQQPLDISQLVTAQYSHPHLDQETYDEHPIRAIHWGPLNDSDDIYTVALLIDGNRFTDDNTQHDFDTFGHPEQYWDHLVRVTSGMATLGETDQNSYNRLNRDIKHNIALLRAIKAIADSPLSRQDHGDTVGTRHKHPKKSRRRKALDLSSIKVVSLRQPEYGQYELDAAAGYQPKTPQRLHWVRGHWRNQWYPSAQEHRPRWIDGFIKGNADYGDVTDRPTVYLATGDTPPAGRHETPNTPTTTEGRTQ